MALTITSITPSSGSAAGGVGCIITGTDFTETTTVEFGGEPAVDIFFSSSTELLCTTPAGPDGPYAVAVDVTVLDGEASDTLTEGFSYTLVAADYDLFMDGFDYYATAQIGMKWRSATDVEIMPTSGRRGGGCLSPTAEGGYVESPSLIDDSGLTVGFALMRKTTDVFGAQFYVDGSLGLECVFLADGSVEMVGDTTDALACSIPLDAWLYVEITAQNGAGSISGTFKLFSSSPCGGSALIFDGTYSVDTALSHQPDQIILNGAVAGNWLIDDFYMTLGITGFGNVQVDAIEADSVVDDGFGTWSSSDGTSTLDACVNATDTAESLLICNPGAGRGPERVLFGYSSVTPETILGTQINAWMSMDPDVMVYNPALQLGTTNFYYYTPSSSDMTGISVGKAGELPGDFGYAGNE